MTVGSTGIAGFSRGLSWIQFDAGFPTLSPSQVLNGKVVGMGPDGTILELGSRLVTLQTEMELAVGDLVQLSIKEVGPDQALVQVARQEGQAAQAVQTQRNNEIVRAQGSTEAFLAQRLSFCRLPVDQVHLAAARQLLVSGLPITRENLERLVGGPKGASIPGARQLPTDAVLAKLIDSYDLPKDTPHLYAARQLLARGLPLTRENLEQLTRVVAQFGSATEPNFQAATYLQTAKLPVTRSTLSILRASIDEPLPLGERLGLLQQILTAATEALETVPGLAADSNDLDVPDDPGDQVGWEVRQLVERALGELSERIVREGGQDRSQLVESLRRIFQDQVTSVENRLLRILAGSADPIELEKDLRVILGRLAKDARELASAQDQPPQLHRVLSHLRYAAPDLADAVQVQQLRNVAEPPQGTEQWIAFQVPFSQGTPDYLRTVELRIRRRAGGRIDPNRVRLVFRLELERLRTVEIRLEILDKRISCGVAGSDAEVLPILREQFGSLREGLERLGYSVGALSFGPLENEPDPTAVAVPVPPQMSQIDVWA